MNLREGIYSLHSVDNKKLCFAFQLHQHHHLLVTMIGWGH